MLYFKFILWTHPKLAALVLPFSMSREWGDVRLRTWGESRIKFDNILFHLLICFE